MTTTTPQTITHVVGAYLVLTLFVCDRLVVADPGEGDHAVERGPAVGEERVKETVQRLPHQECPGVYQMSHLLAREEKQSVSITITAMSWAGSA